MGRLYYEAPPGPAMGVDTGKGAKKYLEKGGKKVSTELYTPLSVENKFITKRSIQGTVSGISSELERNSE